MRDAKQMADEVLNHLAQAQRMMSGIISVSGDWSTRAKVEAEFRSLEELCRNTVYHQFGLGDRPNGRTD
jgi:hypothetical protein